MEEHVHYSWINYSGDPQIKQIPKNLHDSDMDTCVIITALDCSV